MTRNWLVRTLAEAMRTALDMPMHQLHGQRQRDTGIAMLIDMDNVAPAHMDEIMRRAKRHGEIVHRSGFGGTPEKKWREARRAHGILCGRQSQMKAGKNEADFDLTIAAMDLLADPQITGFCIISSDGDFTPIVMRLREAGKLVIGFGENKTPKAFVEACDHFETIGQTATAKKPQPVKNSTSKAATKTPTPDTESKPKNTVNGAARQEFLDLVKRAAANAKQHEGWIHATHVGSQIRKFKPDIAYKDYGHKTLTAILETYPDEIETRGPSERKQIRLRG